MQLPPDAPENPAARGRGSKQKEGRTWQFSIRWLFGLTAVVAVACSLMASFGAVSVAAILGGAAGAFGGAVVCPKIGLGQVLDDLRGDVARCLALGAYVVGGAWGSVVGLPWIFGQAYDPKKPVVVEGALVVLFFTTGFLVRVLWPDTETLGSIVVTIAAVAGALVAVSLLG